MLTLGVTATGCSGDAKPTRPTPKPATADDMGKLLATRLTAGDLGDFPVKSGDPQADIDAVKKGMGGLTPQVVAEDTIRNGTGATVNLKYTWPMAYPWTYTAKAVLANEDNTWKLVWKPDALHPALSSETRLERRAEDGQRGGVTGDAGSVLVGNAPAQMVGIDKSQLKGSEVEAAARALADLLLIDPDQYATRVAAGPDDKVIDAIGVQRNALPAGAVDKINGAVARDMTLPVGRDPGFARQIVGTVTTATADDAAQSHGKIGEGDVMGRDGLQGRFNDQLRGSGAAKVILAPRAAQVGTARATADTTVADFPAKEGANIASTIDLNIQTALEDTLGGSSSNVSAAAIRVSDGAILAAATSTAAKGRPEATAGAFRPGLAGGAAAALALLRSGGDLSDKVRCDDKKSSVSGSTTVSQAITRGCPGAVAQLAGRVQGPAYADAAATLGLTGEPDLGFTARLGTVDDLSADSARAAALSGDGSIAVSALGLATMGASVAGGRAQLPWATETLHPKNDKQLSPSETRALQDLMRSGTSSTSLSGVTGALEGESDGRELLVAYTKDIAYAVVVSDTKTKPESVITQMQAGALRSQPAKSSKSSSSSSSEGND